MPGGSSSAVLVAETDIHVGVERKLIEVLDVLQRIEGQLVQVEARLGQRLHLRRRVLDAGPRNAMDLPGVRVSLLPQVVPVLIRLNGTFRWIRLTSIGLISRGSAAGSRTPRELRSPRRPDPERSSAACSCP